MKKIVIGVGGASGVVYTHRLLEKLQSVKNIKVDLVFSDHAYINWEIELGPLPKFLEQYQIWRNSDFMAPFASGSANYDGLMIVPCSMGLVGKIAAGISDQLIPRTADVMLKERKKLILMVRETPYNLIHLENMTTITKAGGIICPASPSFYSKPKDLNELLDTIVYRLLDLMEIENNGFRWGKEN